MTNLKRVRLSHSLLSIHSFMTDTYLTIKTPGESCYTELRSRFLSFAVHVETEEEAKAELAALRKKYYDARHVCYAYALDDSGTIARQNDDGEPAGTAGAPIARQLVSHGLTRTLVAVVRYFGGVKLGTSRLGVAYKTAAAEALDRAEIIEVVRKGYIKIAVPYADADVAMRYVREEGAEIIGRDYTAEDNLLTVEVRLKDEDRLRERLGKILSLRFTDLDDEEGA